MKRVTWEGAFTKKWKTNRFVHFYVLNPNPFWEQKMAAKFETQLNMQMIILDIRSINIYEFANVSIPSFSDILLS